MPNKRSELEKREILRMSNEESNKITRECLQTALILLMTEKDFDKITITELVKRSGVSRTAFYRNYNSKEDILTEISDKLVQAIADSYADPDYTKEPDKWYLDFFHVIKENSSVVELLLQAHMSKTFLEGIVLISERISLSASIGEHYTRVAKEGAFSYILLDWFREGMKESPEDMSKLCAQILSNL